MPDTPATTPEPAFRAADWPIATCLHSFATVGRDGTLTGSGLPVQAASGAADLSGTGSLSGSGVPFGTAAGTGALSQATGSLPPSRATSSSGKPSGSLNAITTSLKRAAGPR